MSRYLSHLAELTLNRIEPVQPRLSSRFETPLDTRAADKDNWAPVQDTSTAPPADPTSPVMAVNLPGGQKIEQPSADEQASKACHRQQDNVELIEPANVIFTQPDPSGQPPAATPAPRHLPVTPEPVTRFLPTADKAISRQFDEMHKEAGQFPAGPLFVERLTERLTEITHSERIIRELLPSTPNEHQTSSREESENPAPVKPASIKLNTEQVRSESNSASRADYRFGNKPQTDSGPTPAPTIQVSIGRIEIRATQITDKPSAKPRSISNTMSLDDYLKQRSESKS